MIDIPAEPFSGSDRLVYPEVALVSPGCRGTEKTLLECPRGALASASESGVGCFGTDSQGLILACVAEAEDGVLLTT